MASMDANGRRVANAINRAALVLALALLVAIAVLWWRDSSRLRETPRWDESGAVPLRAAAAGGRERWIVAVNPGCPECRDRLARLAGALARRGDGPALGVLLVDVPRRPDSLAGAEGLAAGVWWDSAATWRERWGRKAYGEVLVFSPGGALRRILPPDSSAVPR
jgi:hypothetical protein